MNLAPAIEFVNVDKHYSLRDNDANPFRRAINMLGGRRQQRHQALRNINLTINAGESVGLVGVNGSGKSTLLRLISGITCTTGGNLNVNGRVAGILDVGAGFHPDFSGYENIFFQASLLGLSRRETWSRLKFIEDFCELGEFLNVPVRHYSTGMFLRLGFSISIHTDPEIMVIDEAMAVGDGYFMWKCTEKLRELKAAGTTLVYVSHVAEQAESLCDRGIWIHEGQIQADGPIASVIQDYHQFQFSELLQGSPPTTRPELSAMIPYSRFGTGEAIISNVRIFNAGEAHDITSSKPTRIFQPGDPLTVQFDVTARKVVPAASVYFILERPYRSVTYIDSSQQGQIYTLPAGTTPLEIKLSSLPLTPGPYTLTLAIGPTGNRITMFDAHQKIYSFTINQNSQQTYPQGFLKNPTIITRQ